MGAKWFYRRAGAEHGPVTSGKIRRMVARGELDSTDLLWKLGMEEWRTAGESATLFGRDEARAEKRRREAGGSKRRKSGGRAAVTPQSATPWTPRRPLLMSIGIGAGAGVVISAIIVTLILVSSRSPFEEIDDPAEAVVAPPRQPVAARPAAPQPAAADVAAARQAPAEAVAVNAAPPAAEPAAEPAPADPPAKSPSDPPDPEVPADLQAEAPRKPSVRIRVRLPGDDF